MDVDVDTDAFSVTISSLDGPFDSGGEIIKADNPRGISWKYGFEVRLGGYTYVYNWGNDNWKIDVKMKGGSSPSPSSGPTPTPVPTPTPSQKPGNYDFDIINPMIEFRDSFTLHPKINDGSCGYSSHNFTIKSFGVGYDTRTFRDKAEDFTIGYGQYSNFNIKSAGSFPITMNVWDGCGYTEVTKTLTINPSKNNHPPYFRLGWFKAGDHDSVTPLTSVFIGDKVEVRIIDDQTAIPPTPSDPDGDPWNITGWDFSKSSAWVKSLPEKYPIFQLDYGQWNLKADAPGSHTVYCTIADNQGAAFTGSATLRVEAPNPIPRISGPEEVVERRPLAYPFNADSSYSPMQNVEIDHRFDEWTGRQDRYDVPGTYPITLEVTDTRGLHSLPEDKATKTLLVKPDLPPVPQLNFISTALRTSDVLFTDASYSPDKDKIVNRIVSYKYDSNNNGSFADEASVGLSFNMDLQFSFRPPKVGDYQFTLYVEEDWGMNATKTFNLHVVNEAPWAAYTFQGLIDQPQPVLRTVVGTWDMRNNSTVTNFQQTWLPNEWSENGQTLESPTRLASPYRFGNTGVNGGFTRPSNWWTYPASETIQTIDGHTITFEGEYSHKFQTSGGWWFTEVLPTVIIKDASGTITNLVKVGGACGSTNTCYTGRGQLRLVDDGKLLVDYHVDTFYMDDSEPSSEDEQRQVLSTDFDSSTPNTYNQLYKPGGPWLTNFDLSFEMKFPSSHRKELYAGFAFKLQNNRNMFRVEANGSKIRLVKIVDGNKQVLQETPYWMNDDTYYGIRINSNNNRHKIYVNSIPLFDVTDGAWESGTFGPFSDYERAVFRGMSYSEITKSVSQTENAVLVGDTAQYITSYGDPENDSRLDAGTTWRFDQVNPWRFLDAGDGKSGYSALNGQTVQSPFLSFDKVGLYLVNYSVQDNPHPDYPSDNFAGYRERSQPYGKYINVHRRPIANFTVSVNGDKTVAWNDQSYDPDRWLNDWTYSTEATGIDYRVTRGVVERKYRYTSPSGYNAFAKLTNPTEPGTYIIGLQVKDEYGAWSDWAEQSITIIETPTPKPPNNPPGVWLTFPSGSQVNPSSSGTLQPTITWNQWDVDVGTVFESAQIVVREENGALFRDVSITPRTTQGSWSWVLDMSLEKGKKYQVTVRVSDGEDWSGWSNMGWIITNRKPAASVYDPSGTQASPTIKATTRPTISWYQTDPDAGTIFQKYRVQVTNEANNVMLYDSGDVGQWTSNTYNSMSVPVDLPAGQKLRVRVVVSDGMDWSDWSEQTWMYINRPPVADFDWSPKPVWEGDTVRLQNQSSDPDGDVLTYRWTILQPNGTEESFTGAEVTKRFLLPGDYRVTLTVSDGREEASATKTIQTHPLEIRSEVNHTPEWLALHEEKGHETVRAPKDFYSGEVFMVVTNSSPVPVSAVSAWLDAVGKDGKDIHLSAQLTETGIPNRFMGELYDPVLASLTGGLPDGLNTVHFRITYSNGIVKTEDIPVNILGNVRGFAGVHRVQ